jgi:GWxTD domain-containing protein
VKKIFLAVAGLAFAVSALAQLSKYKDWDKTPEAYFLTPAERTEWKNVKTDEEADKFIAVYYAKRGGEAFQQEISRRIAAADQQFKLQRYKRGADSVRGHLLIVLGTPSRVSQSRAQEGAVDDSGGVTAPGIDTRPSEAVGASRAVDYTWTYLPDKFPGMNIPEFRARVTLDPAQGRDILQNSSEVEKVMATLAEKSIVNPNATAVAAGAAPGAGAKAAPPAGAAAAGAAAAPPPPPPPAPLPAAVKTALEAVAGKNTGEGAFWAGPFRSAVTGDQFLALQFYLASNKPAFAGNTPLKFGGLVTDESGKEVDSFWEDANFIEVTEGTRKDRVFDRSVTLQPGSYKGTFGLFPAEGQPPVASGSVNFKLEGKSTEFGVSPLILASGLTPLTKRPGPADPFVFGTDKPIRVDPKGDRQFLKSDSLWYFYCVENPMIPAAAAPTGDAGAAAPAPSATPAAPGAAASTAAPEPAKPRIMTRINVQRDGQDAFAPFTGPAELVQTSPGVYSTGNEIPLASFEPGYYTFMITVWDLNGPKGPARKTIERKEDFVVLMPDGSMPPKNAPKAAPAPKKKPA